MPFRASPSTRKPISSPPTAKSCVRSRPASCRWPSATSCSDMACDPASDWFAWQVVDSAFPAGAFAHSGGLESAWQQGEVATADDLWAFLVAFVQQAGHASLPLVNAAYRAPHRVADLDELADAFLLNVVANRARPI